MLRIKFILTGKKHAPTYRIGVGEGSAVKETFGIYNPQISPPEFTIDKKRLEYWLSQGAKLSESVDQLIRGKYEFKPYSPKKGESESGSATQAPAEAAPKAQDALPEAPAEATRPEEALDQETEKTKEVTSQSGAVSENPEEKGKSNEETA